jgi:ElaB/YqjD/DUF883 family membrane-anchored ribosome-binding protein
MGQSTEELRQEIEDTRVDLSRDLDAIGDRVSPKRMAQRRWDKTRNWTSSAREAIFGKAEEMKYAMEDKARSAADVGRSAPEVAREKTSASPFIAGAVAFGFGFLMATVLPTSETEQEAASKLEDKVEPVKQQLTSTASHVKSTLMEEGKQAASDLKDDVRDRASDVSFTAKEAAQRTKDDVQESRS